MKAVTKTVLTWTILLCFTVVMGLPFFWLVASSFKPNEELFQQPPTFIPQSLTLEHFEYAFSAAPFSRYFANSIIVTSIVMFANLLMVSLAGYAFAKFTFRHKNVIFFSLLATMMVPFHIILVPLFLMARMFPLVGGNDILGAGGVGLMNSYTGLALPHLMPAFGVFLMRQFLLSVPDDLIHAARIDGCSELRIYWQIILPISKPALATLGIFTFNNVWDDFLWPLVVTTGSQMRTVQLGLQVFQGQYSVNWGPLMAATLAVTMPMVIVFLFGQKHFVQGIATTGIKE